MRNTLRFKSNDFNSSVPQDYFINECCYGDDVARWLKPRLERSGYQVDEPAQEDWGWVLGAEKDGSTFMLCIGYIPYPDDLWQIFIEPHIGLLKRSTRAPMRHSLNDICSDIHYIVSRDGAIRDVKWLQMAKDGEESDLSDRP